MYSLSEYLHLLQEAPNKWRDRVEVFIIKDKNKLIVGQNKNGTYYAAGGGLDGDTFEKAAEKESLEELGVKISDAKLIDDTPLYVDWYDLKDKGVELSDFVKDRMRIYRGARTFFMYATFERVDKSLYGIENDNLSPVVFHIDHFIDQLKKQQKEDVNALGEDFVNNRIKVVQKLKRILHV